MNESALLKSAIISGVAGLAALFVISLIIELPVTNTYDLDSSRLGKDVRIRGVVSSVKDSEKVMLLEVSQSKPVTVVVFKGSKFANFSVGDEVEVIGQVKEFRGKLEVVAEKVKIKEEKNTVGAREAG